MNGLSLSRVSNPQARWYRGDFHLHTTASSDELYSPQELVQLARTEGLDFFAVTDHNSIDAFTQFGDLFGFLVIPGIEVTLREGHFNVFGMEGWRDWMEHICVSTNTIPFPSQLATITDLMRQIAEQGLFNSINHPLLPPWDWQDGATDLRNVHFLEVWNDPLWPGNVDGNPKAVEMWTAWLNAGYRITAIGGSDFHVLPEDRENYPGERPGLPITWVYANELSANAILTGLRRRRAYVSMGPKVTFEANASGTTYDIGADLGKIDKEVLFTATVSGDLDAARLEIVRNGSVIGKASVRDGDATLQLSDRVDPDQSAWYRLDVFDQRGSMLALTNPIFAGSERQPDLFTFEDFVKEV